MRSSCRIVAAVWVLIALAPSAFAQPNVICVESSGRISYSCNDVVPDDVAARFAVPTHLGLSSEDCGFCHDYAVGQAVTQSFQDLVLPVPLIGPHQEAFFQRVSALLNESQAVAFLDSSGIISPLKC
jgi:hypothetical protein